MLRRVRVEAAESDEDDHVLPNTGSSHMDLEFPPTPNHKSSLTKGGLHGAWKRLDENYLRRWFGGCVVVVLCGGVVVVVVVALPSPPPSPPSPPPPPLLLLLLLLVLLLPLPLLLLILLLILFVLFCLFLFIFFFFFFFLFIFLILRRRRRRSRRHRRRLDMTIFHSALVTNHAHAFVLPLCADRPKGTPSLVDDDTLGSLHTPAKARTDGVEDHGAGHELVRAR